MAEFHTFHIENTPPKNYSIFVRLQTWFDQKLTTLFPEEGRDLLSGILLGQRSSMDTDLQNALKRSGLMHLMVVSG